MKIRGVRQSADCLAYITEEKPSHILSYTQGSQKSVRCTDFVVPQVLWPHFLVIRTNKFEIRPRRRFVDTY
jgi:hypothetical protein